MNKRIVIADHHNVHRHLAAEELLLDTLPENTTLLYLWVADKSVVIGKNQNPWIECNLPELERRNCALARRISGGGAVYHDPGNLNYAFFVDKEGYDRTALSEIILTAVRSFGIDCEIGPRHLLQANGKKFSGNAFCFRRGKALHHGTLLVDADIHALNGLLQPTLTGIEAKGIRSVPSEVVNLTELAPSVTVDELKAAVEAAFNPTEPPTLVDVPDLDDRTAVFASDAWLYHRTPVFTATGVLNNHPDNPAFRATVKSGKVQVFEAMGFPKLGHEYSGMDFRDFADHAGDVTLT